MKTRFLFITISVFLFNYLYAQTEHPKPSIIENGKVYYLYNVNNKGFLVGGNQYGTQASLDYNHAYKVILNPWVNNLGKWDNETYYITDSVEAGDYRGDYRNVFIENNGNVFVDQNTLPSTEYYKKFSTKERDCLWTIKQLDGGASTYQIIPSKHNTSFNSQDLRFSVKNNPKFDLPVVGLFRINDNDGDEWMFVEPKEAERWLSERIRKFFESKKDNHLEIDKVYYLYNINKKGFLVGGNQYGTQASIARDHAYKVKLFPWFTKKGTWDGETYIIKDSVEVGDFRKSFRNIFVEKNGKIFVDQNNLDPETDSIHSTKKRDCLWSIKPSKSDSLVYIIKPSEYNKLYNNQDFSFCARNEPSCLLPVVGLYKRQDETEEGWKFMLPEEAQKVLSERVYERQHRKNEMMQMLLERFSTNEIPVEDTVYMFNVAFEKFLIGENIYKSEASLSSENANKVVIHKYYNDNSEWNGLTCYITDSVESGNYPGAYRNIFIEKNGKVWVDQAEKTSNLDCLWDIVPSKRIKGAFNICPSKQNAVFSSANYPNRWLGSIDFHAQDYPLVSLVCGISDSAASEWMFLTKAQYELVKQTMRRQILLELIMEVYDAYPAFDLNAFQQICDNENSTAKDIEIAIGNMRLMLLSGGDPTQQETSFTPLLLNPDFAWPAGRGWHAAYDVQLGKINWCGGLYTNPCSEAWQSEYNFYQKLNGVPRGLFRIDIQAFSRTRGADLAWIERDSSLVSPVVYANEMELPVHNLMHRTFANKEDFDYIEGEHLPDDASWQTLDGEWAPHNQASASLAFQKGYYDQSVYCYVDNGCIIMGIKDEHKRTGAWTAWDNLRVTYIPETDENYRIAVNNLLDKAKELLQLARHKKVDAQILEDALDRTERAIEAAEIGTLRDQLMSINTIIKDVRRMLFKQEFGNDGNHMIYAESDDEEDQTEKNNEKDSIKVITDRAESYYFLGRLLRKENEALSIKHLQKAIDLYYSVFKEEKSVLTYLDDCVISLSNIYENNELFDDAINIWMTYVSVLKQKNSISSKLIDAYRKVGDIYHFNKKDYSHAENYYRKGLESIESSYYVTRNGLVASWLNSLSYALLYQNKFDEALTTIDRAINLQPEEANYYDSKGEILYKKGDIEGAKEMWDKVVSLDSNFAQKNDSDLYKCLFMNKSAK